MAATVKIALVSRTVFYAPVWVAEQNGYFRDEGVEPGFEIFDNAEKINAVMHSGEAQIAIASIEALVADAFKGGKSSGGKFRIVASVAQKPPHFIIARPHIRTVTDLKGARFGVLSLHEGTTYFVQDIEKALGWQRGDIVIDAVGGAPTRWKLLREGKIDAGLQPFPLSYQAEAAGFTNFGPITRYLQDYLFTTVNVDSRWAEANGGTLRAFLRGLRAGIDAMNQDRQGAIATAAKELNTTPALAERALDDTAKLKILSQDLSISEQALRGTFDTLLNVGLLPRDARFDPARMVDARYLPR